MRTKTQSLMLQGGLIVTGALIVSTLGAWARGATAEDHPAPATAPALLAELRALGQQLEATRGELEVARVQLERAHAVIEYSAQYNIPANLSAAIYDIAQSEGIDPDLGFRLVRVESRFKERAKSSAGALGLTQVLPSTGRLYEPGLTHEQLYDRDTNLRLGFRYLRDLLERYDGNLETALLAYNRGPGKVEGLLNRGQDARNGYSASVMKGYKRQ
jgi:soluble lytic murein transglycosylase-like protein